MEEEHFLHLLKKKRGFFEAILELSEGESSLPVQEWILQLQQKKILLQCVEKVDEELSRFKEYFEILSQEAHEEISEMERIIQHILHLDERHMHERKGHV